MKPLLPGVRKLTHSARSISARFGWGVADQALSSLTNFAIGFLAARALSSTDFGAFAVIFSVYLIGLGTSRAVTSEPFVIRYAAVSRADWPGGAASATGSALVIGLTGAIACVVAGLIAGGSLGTGLLALGVTMPGLLLQDVWRFTFFAVRRGSSAFTNDLVWGLMLLTGVAVLLQTDTRSVGWLVLAWGGAGTAAGLFGLLQSSVVPAPQRSVAWVRQHRDLVPRFLGEFTVTTAVSQITVFGLGAIAGLAEVGALRAGTLLLGPLNVLFLGVSIVAVPEGVRALLDSTDRLLRASRRLSLALAAAALTAGAVLWSLPDPIGTALLRENWAGGRSVIIPLALGVACLGVLLGAGVGLRSLAAARLSLRARLLAAPISLIGGLGGAVLGAAVGAAWGMAIALGAGALIWWRYFLRGLREHEEGDAGPPSGSEDAILQAAPEDVPYA